jgi:hypothetical protein
MAAHLFGGRSLPGTPSDFMRHLWKLALSGRLPRSEHETVRRMQEHVDDVQRQLRMAYETSVPALQDAAVMPIYTGREGELVWYAVESRCVFGGAQHQHGLEARPVRATDVEHTLRHVYGTTLRRDFSTAWISQMARSAAACVVELPLSACSSYRAPELSQRERLRRRGVYFVRAQLPTDAYIERYLQQTQHVFTPEQRAMLWGTAGETRLGDGRLVVDVGERIMRWPPPMRGRRRKPVGAADDGPVPDWRLVEHDLPLCVVPVLALVSTRTLTPEAVLLPPVVRNAEFRVDIEAYHGNEEDASIVAEQHRELALVRQPPLTPMLLHTFYRKDAPGNEYLMLVVRAVAAMLGVDALYLPDTVATSTAAATAPDDVEYIDRHYRLLDSLALRFGSRQRLWEAVCHSLEQLQLDGAGRAVFAEDATGTLLVALRAFLVYVTPASHVPVSVAVNLNVGSLPPSSVPPTPGSLQASPAVGTGIPLPPSASVPSIGYVSGRARAALRNGGVAPGRMRHVVDAQALRVLRYLFARLGTDAGTLEEEQRRADEAWPAQTSENMWRRYPALGLFTLVASMRWEHEGSQAVERGLPAPTALAVQETVDIFLRDGRAADPLVTPVNEETLRAARYPWLNRTLGLRKHPSFAAMSRRAAQTAPFALELFELVADSDYVRDSKLARALMLGISVRGVHSRDRLGPLPGALSGTLEHVPLFIGSATPLQRYLRGVHALDAALHPLPPARPAFDPAADALGALLGFLEEHVPVAIASRRAPTACPPPSHYAPGTMHAYPEMLVAMHTEIAAAVPATEVFAVYPKPEQMSSSSSSSSAAGGGGQSWQQAVAEQRARAEAELLAAGENAFPQ